MCFFQDRNRGMVNYGPIVAKEVTCCKKVIYRCIIQMSQSFFDYQSVPGPKVSKGRVTILPSANTANKHYEKSKNSDVFKTLIYRYSIMNKEVLVW